MKLKFKLIVLFLFFIGVTSVKAQHWEAGVSIGGMGYMGDLNQTDFHKINNLAYGVMVKRNFDSYWSLRFSFLQGKISADDADSKYEQQRDRNLSFFSPISEVASVLEFNFFDYGLDFGQSRITPFIYTGISFFRFNPKTKLHDEVYELKRYFTEFDSIPAGKKTAYSTSAFAIPVGAGIKYKINEKLNLTGEFSFRTAQTDYLDDVSGRYPNITENSFEELTRKHLSDRTQNNIYIGTDSQRGDFRKKDTYIFVGITLSYTFVRQNCPF